MLFKRCPALPSLLSSGQALPLPVNPKLVPPALVSPATTLNPAPALPSRQALLLAELNKVSPRDVLARVESREYGSGPAVVVEYLRALVATNQLAKYSTAGQGGAEEAQSKNLVVLLKDLQVGGGSDGWVGAGGGARPTVLAKACRCGGGGAGLWQGCVRLPACLPSLLWSGLTSRQILPSVNQLQPHLCSCRHRGTAVALLLSPPLSPSPAPHSPSRVPPRLYSHLLGQEWYLGNGEDDHSWPRRCLHTAWFTWLGTTLLALSLAMARP